MFSRIVPLPLIFSLVAGSLAVSQGALASGLEAREQRMDRRELRDDRGEERDDRVDAKTLNRLVNDWYEARAHLDVSAERSADADLKRWLNQEMREARGERREDDQEVRRSKREMRRARGEVAFNDPVEHRALAVNDRHDLRDDRRDLRDDKRDAQQNQARSERTHEIAMELRGMQPAFDEGSASLPMYERKSALLYELQGMAQAELDASKAERHEDRAERREDRRERVEP